MEKAKKTPEQADATPQQQDKASKDNPKHKEDFEGLLDLASEGLSMDNPKRAPPVSRRRRSG